MILLSGIGLDLKGFIHVKPLFCVSIFDGEQFKGEWFDSVIEAIHYFETCAIDGRWKDIQLQRWTDDELAEVTDKE